MYLMSFFLGLALGLKGSAHDLAIGLTCTRVMNKKKKNVCLRITTTFTSPTNAGYTGCSQSRLECLLLSTSTLTYILSQQLRSTLAYLRASPYERKISKWIMKLREYERIMLQNEDMLRRFEAESKSHVKMEAIRIARERLSIDREHVRMQWEEVKLDVELHMLYQPSLNINLPNPAPRVEISGTKTEGM